MSEAAQILSQAFELIEQDNLASARNLLDSIKASNERNPDFWWVYLHAVETEEEGRDALNRVLALDPGFPGARALSDEMQGSGSTIKRLRPMGAMPPPPPGMLGAAPSTGSKRRNIFLLIILCMIIAIVGILVFPELLSSSPTPEIATSVAVQPTVLPDVTEEIVGASGVDATPTIEVMEATPEEPASTQIPEDFGELAANLSQYDVPPNGIFLEETILGNTLVITTCAPPGPLASQSIAAISDSFQSQVLADDIEGIGFSITNCSEERTLRVIGINREGFELYLQGDMSRPEFQQALQPIQ